VKGVTLKPVAILGAGSWGTALALYLGRRGQTIKLWSIDTAEINEMLSDRRNRFLPEFSLPDEIKPMSDLAAAVADVDDVIIVVPSVGFRSTLNMLKPLISTKTRITCATKGLDADTGKLLSEVVDETLGKEHKFAMLSGPSFAREVAAGLPAAVVIASRHRDFVNDLIQRFNSPIFRIYPSDDIAGVEIGGVVKNVIAIATGMFDGMALGANARSALITHGLEEMIALGAKLGGRLETFIGLSGLGDLILTCSDDLSRNRRMGLALGKGKAIKEAEREIGQVVEGKRNAEIVVMLANRLGVEMPICNAVWNVVNGKLSAKEVVTGLLASHTPSALNV